MNINLNKTQTKEFFSPKTISSIALIILSFFYIFWVTSFFEVGIYSFENRATNYTAFDIYIFDKYIDSAIISLLTTLWFSLSLNGKTRIISAAIYGSFIIAVLLSNFTELLDAIVLVSIPSITLFFVYHIFTKKTNQLQTNFYLRFFSLTVLSISISGMVIVTFSQFSFFTISEFNPALDIFLIISSFSPLMIFFLLGGSIIKLIFIKIQTFKKNLQQKQIISQTLPKKSKFYFLAFFLFLSIFLSLLPHQSFINSENELVGSDSADYVKWMKNIGAEDPSDFMYGAFLVQNSGDRPLSLILFSPVLTIFPENSSEVIDHLPIILSPLLVLAAFFLTREITSNDTISLLASFLTAISFQMLIGVYAGLYANWLALIFGYISIGFLLKFLKKSNRINYLGFSIFWFLMLTSHFYTWIMIALFASIFLIVTWRLKIFEKKKIALVFVIIITSFAFDAGKSFFVDADNGLGRNMNNLSEDVSFLKLSSIWDNLTQTSLVYAGGVFGNFLILSLCIFWLLRSNFREVPNLFIAIFLSIGFLPILFGGELIQSRVLLNIPFQIPAAIGLFYIVHQHKSRSLLIAISLWILTISIQSIANFI